MKTATLRAFFPTTNATAYEAHGTPFQLIGHDPVFDVAGCGKSLTLNFRGEVLNFSVTSVEAGEEITVKRGGGLSDINETFGKDGIVLHAPIRARPEMLRILRGRPVQLDVDFEPMNRLDRSSALTARVTGLRLAKRGERGDAELTLID